MSQLRKPANPFRDFNSSPEVIRMHLFVLVLIVFFLAACNRSEPLVPTLAEQESAAAAKKASSSEPLSIEQLVLLKSSSCRVVAEAFVKAIRQGDYNFAAHFWHAPAVGAEEIKTLFRGYEQPNVHIAEVQDGGSDSTACTAAVALSDDADPARPLRPGKLLFRSAPDSSTERHWILQSSTFLEPMQRSGTGEPA